MKKRVAENKKAKIINKNIDYRRFNRDPHFQGKNCCYHPVNKYIDEEILPSEYVSNTMRTRTIMDQHADMNSERFMDSANNTALSLNEFKSMTNFNKL